MKKNKIIIITAIVLFVVLCGIAIIHPMKDNIKTDTQKMQDEAQNITADVELPAEIAEDKDDNTHIAGENETERVYPTDDSGESAVNNTDKNNSGENMKTGDDYSKNPFIGGFEGRPYETDRVYPDD